MRGLFYVKHTCMFCLKNEYFFNNHLVLNELFRFIDSVTCKILGYYMYISCRYYVIILSFVFISNKI